MSIFNNPTLQLLNSSSLVGFSGGLRLYLAYLIAGIAPDILLVLAASLIIYATYTLDRSLDNKEDEVNRRELVGACKSAGIAASVAAIIIGTALFFSKNLFGPPLFPFIVGILYSQGLSLGHTQIKLKGGCGIKNIVIGITWGGTIGLIIASTGQVAAAAVIGVYFGMKLFINSTIFDIKDVEGDLAAGIRTLPVVMGVKKLTYLLLSLCIVQHALLIAAMMGGILVPFIVLFLYSLSMSGLAILCYSPAFESGPAWWQRNFRVLVINWEPIVLVVVSMFHPY